MKKKIQVVGCAVISFCVIICAIMILTPAKTLGSEDEWKEEQRPMIINKDIEHEGLLNINYQLLGSYDFDTIGLRRHYDAKEGEPFTFFLQMRDLGRYTAEYLEGFYPECGFILPEFGIDNTDYPNKYFAITMGRKIVDMQYEYFGEPYPPNYIARGYITFSEGYYDNTLFLYVTDNIRLGPDADLGEYYFYVMKGEEKVFEGEYLGQVNTFNEEFKENLREQYKRWIHDNRGMG